MSCPSKIASICREKCNRMVVSLWIIDFPSRSQLVKNNARHHADQQQWLDNKNYQSEAKNIGIVPRTIECQKGVRVFWIGYRDGCTAPRIVVSKGIDNIPYSEWQECNCKKYPQRSIDMGIDRQDDGITWSCSNKIYAKVYIVDPSSRSGVDIVLVGVNSHEECDHDEEIITNVCNSHTMKRSSYASLS